MAIVRCLSATAQASSYAQACDLAAKSGGRFAAAGIVRGDRVAILCGNRTEFVDLFLGLAWIGAVSVPINVAARGAQLEHMLKTSGARLLVLETEWLSALEFVDFAKLAVETIWVIDPAPDMPAQVQTCAGAKASRSRRAGRGRRPEAARSSHHPVHLRHDRTVEGRLLSACAIFLVGLHRRAPARIARRRRAAHHAAAVPCQRAVPRCFRPCSPARRRSSKSGCRFPISGRLWSPRARP